MENYKDTVLEQLTKQLDSDENPKPKSGRGGARPGAGRKRVYQPYESTRLKCRLEHAGLANAFISILDKFSKKVNGKAWACRLDGSQPKTKGKGLRTWTDMDAITSEFSLSINGSCDSRIFAVACKKVRPEGVMVDGISYRSVRLRWQRADEVSRLMMEYGWLMARRNRLDAETEALLNEVPLSDVDIPTWING